MIEHNNCVITNKPSQKVSLLIARTAGASSRILEGIGSWMRAHRQWVVQLRDPKSPGWKRIKDFQPQGIIAEVDNRDLARQLAKFNCPVINIKNTAFLATVPAVCADDKQVGRLQAEHLLHLGHRNLVFLGNFNDISTRERFAGFHEEAQRGGVAVRRFDLATEVRPHPYQQWTKIVGNWLLQQSLPMAIATGSAEDATNVAQRCLRRGIRIPEQVVLVSVDDDLSSMEICDPPVSTVRLPFEQIGFRAASLMQEFLDNPIAVSAESQQIAPLGLTIRRSSEMEAVDDPTLAKAVRFIRDHASQPIGVDEVAAHCGLSRRMLQKRFSEKLRTTPFAEIRFHQIEYVRDLLVETDYSVEQIANHSAFAHTAHLIEAFRKAESTTPGEYRRQRRKKS